MVADQKVVTVFIPDDPAQQALAESVLREHGIAYAAQSAEIQNLFGAGEIGAPNPAIGPVRIQVSGADLERSRALLSEALGEEAARSVDLATEESAQESRSPVEEQILRYSRYSLVWAGFWFGGLGSLLGIYFGLKALALGRQEPDVPTGKAKLGLSLGLMGLAWMFLWLWKGSI